MMMPTPTILIIHNPREAAQYSALLEKTGAKVHAITSFEEANEVLSFVHPDLILLPSQMEEGDGRLYCQQIRATLTHPRPVLVLLHDSEDVAERISLFRYGADDVLGGNIDRSELAIRILAHLRRRQEELCNPLTQMPGTIMIRRMLEQVLLQDRPWAALSIDLNNLRIYNETYGDLAGDQLIKALGAVCASTVGENEFAGHLEADDFLVITTPERRIHCAELITQQFNEMSKRFYPPEIIERGYLISTGRGGIRRRVPLVSIAIGIVCSSSRRFQSYVDVLTSSRDSRYLAKSELERSWVEDGESTPERSRTEHTSRSSILVVEPDGAMACLLQEILSLEGYIVEVTSSANDALSKARASQPDLILLESNLADRRMDGWGLCRTIKEDAMFSRCSVVMVTSHPDQVLALDSGADLYMPKPFDMPSLLLELSQLLRTRPRV
ncbi:MAG: response regulator [Candidatus Obscuribacterales bacterium]|nr:response regulator [Candidatus Obscuribacterales bacterium]